MDRSNAPAVRPAGAADPVATAGGDPLISELLKSLPDPVIGCDGGGRVVYWSPAAGAAYGYGAPDAVGQRVSTLLETRFQQPPLEILDEVADLGRWQGQLVHRARDGREVAVESRWISRRDDTGTLVGWFAVERPIPAADRSRGQLSVPAAPGEAVRDPGGRAAEPPCSAGRLAESVAHDLHNALAIVINYTALVSATVTRLRAAPTDSERETLGQDLAEIGTAAQRGAELTSGLLEHVRQALMTARGGTPP